MNNEREMDLDEWCARLPSCHRVNRELKSLRKLAKALEHIALQMTVQEVEATHGEDVADYQGAYDAIVREARAALRELKEKEA